MEDKKFTDFYEAYHFLKDHKMVNKRDLKGYMRNAFEDVLYISVVKINPLINKIDDRDHMNIETRIWLEFGSIEFDNNNNLVNNRDTRLECDGETFEEAIIELANLVNYYYDDEGEERVDKDIKHAKIKSEQFFNKEKNWILNWTYVLDKYDNIVTDNHVIIDMTHKQIINMNPVDIWEINWEEIK